MKAEMNNEEDSKRAKKLDETMEGLQNQGTKIANTMENTSIQDNQRQELQF